MIATQLLAVLETVMRHQFSFHAKCSECGCLPSQLVPSVHIMLLGLSPCLTPCSSMTAGQKKRDAFQEVTPKNAGQTLFTRCERETLVRFPKTQAILFTIRTYIRDLAWYAARPNECATLADALRNLPEDLVSQSPHDLPRLTNPCKKAWQMHVLSMQ